MRIVCLRTGKTLVDKLSVTEVSSTMEQRIRQACYDNRITPENTDKIVENYRKRDFHPFMFDVRP